MNFCLTSDQSVCSFTMATVVDTVTGIKSTQTHKSLSPKFVGTLEIDFCKLFFPARLSRTFYHKRIWDSYQHRGKWHWPMGSGRDGEMERKERMKWRNKKQAKTKLMEGEKHKEGDWFLVVSFSVTRKSSMIPDSSTTGQINKISTFFLYL